jgi:hypothetical protein
LLETKADTDVDRGRRIEFIYNWLYSERVGNERFKIFEVKDLISKKCKFGI